MCNIETRLGGNWIPVPIWGVACLFAVRAEHSSHGFLHGKGGHRLKPKSLVLALTLGAALLATGFVSPRLPLVTRASPGAEEQKVVWLMLSVNDVHIYERGLVALWDVPSAKWDATGKALSDRDRAFFNAMVVPALGLWRREYEQCPIPGWNMVVLGQRW